VDKKFPFYKPFVKHANMREGSAKSQAEHEITKRMARGYTITATVGGHSQNGKNYRANNIAYLVDQDLGIDGHFLMLRRKLRMNKQEGQKTEITMGLPIEGYAVQ
jgi:prophage tail gpP-like protein